MNLEHLRRGDVTRGAIRSVVGVFALLAIASCYPTSGDVFVSDLDTVTTAFDNKVDFSGNSTYEFADSVIHLDIDGKGDSTITRSADATIIGAIRSNMSNYGYTEIAPGGTSDIQLIVYVVTNQNFGVYTSYPWWNNWGYWPGWGCCGPGWGWGYGWSTVYSYQVGTLVVQMVDEGAANGGDQTVPTYWVAAANGLLQGSGESLDKRVKRAIDQAYVQSPYLDVSQ